MLAIIAAAVACGIIGAGTGYFYRKKIAEGKIGQAEIEAQRILTTAQQNAEARKKELCSPDSKDKNDILLYVSLYMPLHKK